MWDCITEPMLTERSVDFKNFFRGHIKQVWIYAFALFTSRNFYSANIDEIDRLRGLFEELANGAKHESPLSGKETLFDLVVLRTVWNMIDIGEAYVLMYKQLANLFLAIHLACSIATVFVVTLAEEINQLVAESAAGQLSSASIVLYIAVTNTAVAAMSALINPSVRWRQVRAMMQQLPIIYKSLNI